MRNQISTNNQLFLYWFVRSFNQYKRNNQSKCIMIIKDVRISQCWSREEEKHSQLRIWSMRVYRSEHDRHVSFFSINRGQLSNRHREKEEFISFLWSIFFIHSVYKNYLFLLMPSETLWMKERKKEKGWTLCICRINCVSCRHQLYIFNKFSHEQMCVLLRTKKKLVFCRRQSSWWWSSSSRYLFRDDDVQSESRQWCLKAREKLNVDSICSASSSSPSLSLLVMLFARAKECK